MQRHLLAFYKVTKQRDNAPLNQVKFAKTNGALAVFLFWRHSSCIVYQLRTVSLFSNRDSKVAKCIAKSHNRTVLLWLLV